MEIVFLYEHNNIQTKHDTSRERASTFRRRPKFAFVLVIVLAAAKRLCFLRSAEAFKEPRRALKEN